MNKTAIWILFFVLTIFVFAAWYLYPSLILKMGSFNGVIDGKRFADGLGTFGDAYGALNTLFSGVAFAALLISILFQSAELSATREEMKDQGEQFKQQTEMLNKQSFENTLFQLMSFNNEMVQSLSISLESLQSDRATGRISKITNVIVGRPVFFELHRIMTEMVEQASHEISNASTSIVGMELMNATPFSIYDKFHEDFEDKIGPCFRGVYQALKLIDDSAQNAFDKKRYADIVAAQISKFEMILLYYHGLSQIAEKNFKSLLEKYEFFESISSEFEIYWRDMLDYNISVFGWSNKKRYVEYLLAYTKSKGYWRRGKKVIAYLDGEPEPYDVTDMLTGNIERGIINNKLIWVNFAGQESPEWIAFSEIARPLSELFHGFERPTKVFKFELRGEYKKDSGGL